MHTSTSGAARTLRRAIAAVSLALLAAAALACATPVGIRRTSLREVDRELAENLISGDRPSSYSSEYLERLGLASSYADHPRQALELLRAGLGGPDDHDRLFALSELWFGAARDSGDRGEYLASALFAYAFLFPGDPKAGSDPYDDRIHIAIDLYDRALTNGLAAPESDRGIELDLTPRQIEMPFGTFVLEPQAHEFHYGGYQVVHPVALGDLEIRGLRNRYRRTGIGAAVVAGVEPAPGVEPTPWVPPNAKVPITVFVRLDAPRENLDRAVVHGALEIHDADETPVIEVRGRTVPLAFEPSAALAYRLEGAPVWDFEIAGFRNPGLLLAAVERTKGLAFINPYRPGRIPVVLVHGTASSPARWAELGNELAGDPRIASRFQLWLFIYNSGNPILLSAANLRDALRNAVHTLDPEGKDPALQQMVVIGHSQGGLLTKLMVVSSGDAFLKANTDRSFDEIAGALSPETAALLKRAMFFEPLPFVRRVVFISTPHRGSYLAENWLGMLARKLVNAPVSLTKASLELATLSERLPELRGRRFRIPTSVDNMDWSSPNPALRVLASLPIAPGVHAHSIIPVESPPIETGEDGVVKYQSAHIEPVDSELVVLGSGHSTQDRTETIEEVRRILYLHAGIR